MPRNRPTLDEFKEKLMKDPKDKALYASLESEYKLLEQMIEARLAAGLSQNDVAERMGTRKSNISRLENSCLQNPSPNLSTLKKYAAAVNCHIEINLVPNAE
ncbi:MAG: helix-turn-helix domain-containing protein [Gammaproteobacteria bacterium]